MTIPGAGLIHEPQAAPIGQPETQGIPQQETAPQEGQQAPEANKGPIPYERFEQVVRQNQEMRAKLSEFDEKIKAISNPAEKLEAMEARKREEQEYWKNPFEYERRREAQRLQEIQQAQEKHNAITQFEITKMQFRTSPEYSPDLENKMSKYISEHQLGRLGLAEAVKASFEAVTGRKFGEWQAGNYQTTRNLKERLTRASSGGGARQPMLSEEDFAKIPAEEYEKNPQKYNEQLQAYMLANR